MTSEQKEKLRSVTYTSGTIKDIANDCEQLNIRGSVTLHKEVSLKKISTHGYSSFHSNVKADNLRSSGSCTIKGSCEIREIVNTDNLKMKEGRATKVFSSGQLTVEEVLQSEQFDATGNVQAKEIHAKDFQLTLAGRSTIGRLITEEICIKTNRKTLSLFKKKIRCNYIKGKNLQLVHTDAEVVEGDTVLIGENCKIQTLFYKDRYTLSKNATIQQIIRRENNENQKSSE